MAPAFQTLLCSFLVLGLLTSPGRAQVLELDYQQVFSVGHGNGDPEFGRIVGLAFAPGGRVAVLDQLALQVVILDDAGHVLQRWGRRGEGPGELERPTSLTVSSTGRVAVADGLFVEMYDTDGGLLEAYPTGDPVQLVMFAPDDELILVSTPILLTAGGPTTSLRVERASDGQVYRQIPVDRWRQVGELFSPRPVVAMTGDFVVLGNSHEYKLDVLEATTGDLVYALSRTVEHRVIENDFQAKVRRYLTDPRSAPEGWTSIVGNSARPIAPEQVRQLSFSPRFPLIGRVVAGPWGTIWVQRGLGVGDSLSTPADPPDRARPLWDVFRDGRWEGTVALPEGFNPYTSQGDLVVGVQGNALDVPAVRVLRVPEKWSRGIRRD